MVYDDSHAKAVIRRGITDYEPKFNHAFDQLRRALESKSSKTAFFKCAISHALSEFDGVLLSHDWKTSKYHRRETHYFFYLSLESILKARQKNSNYYPSAIPVNLRIIDSKTLHKCQDDIGFALVTTHCLERVLRRSKVESLRGCLGILEPVWSALLNVSVFYISRRPSEGSRFILYFREGYVVLGVSDQIHPVVITWMPASWFTDSQIAKFYNIDFRMQNFYLFEEHAFYQKTLLSMDDCLLDTTLT